MWTTALALVVVALAALELFWRSLGFAPGPVDDEPITWTELREEASQRSPRSVVLLGTSRSRQGLDPRLVEAEVPSHRVFQLAIAAANPQPVFANVARDPRFAGVVVYEVMPSHLFAPRSEKADISDSYVRLLEEASPAALTEAWVLRAIRRHVVAVQEQTQLVSALRGLVMHRRRPWPPFFVQRADRGYDPVDAAVVGTARAAEIEAAAVARARAFVDAWYPRLPAADPMERIDARLGEMAEMRSALEARGARVLFVRLPSCGAVFQQEERLYPRARYYERAARRVGGTWLSFEDDPEMRGATCVDGSHMDVASGRRASRALGRRLAELVGEGPLPR